MTSYLGMNATTGRAITDQEHERQSVADILGTPIGSMVTLREYGSYNRELIDQPMTPALRLQIMASSVMALMRWEPRLTPVSVDLTANEQAEQPGTSWQLGVVLARKEGPQSGQQLTVDVPLTRRAAA
ncbi:GPW/gp25 family protein [Crenobacter sp. SG2303]|uniref:GPW/gp25 family protein n=1 Tax=Crenobacter oryzisoli TaxID=3056844 RepID=A0ABT7XP70_9NEIS|nr:GPW/gp25 family protein [Crenobacter sp. SG2303]MDN0075599.1 GPW/gp25 family protein [Crenobacter sp. SG2303]